MIERRNGSIRNKRLNPNLLDSSFQLDQRSVWEIMGYISSYLEHINYYNIDNEKDGQWDEIVKNDPVIFMATIINKPLNDLKDLALNYAEINTIDNANLKTITTLQNWYKTIYEWQTNLLRIGEVKLAYKVKNVLVDVLDVEVSKLVNYHKLIVDENHNKEKKHEIDLSKIIHTFQKIIIHIQEFTKDYLKQNIFSENTHMPNNAIYIAFALLFKTAQDNLNTFSKKHLDFYYKDILRQKNNSGSPTKTIVSFELLPSIENSLIVGGTELNAGKLFNSKDDIIFKTEKPIVACQIKLVELQTLFFNKSPIIKIGTKDQLISSVSKNNLIIDGKDVEPKENWFVFGANKKSLQSAQIDATTIADIGFIIGSPALILSEGRRSIDLKVNMQTASQQIVFWELLNQIQEERKITMDTVFSEVFSEGLRISYTTKKGWSKFKEYSVDYSQSDNYFIIHLVLESSDPALEDSAKIKEQLTWPSIKIELNVYSPIYLYSFFNGLEINTIDIDVEVDRMRDLSLYNNLGKMPIEKSFDLFGPFANVGSYLMIGKSELFQKQLHSLSVNFIWDSLPSDYGGFETYYNGYSESIKNDSFKVQLTALSNSYWLPTNLHLAPIYNLYTSHSCLTAQGYKSVQLDESSIIELNQFEEFGTSLDLDLKDPLKYSVNTRSGYIKLTLVYPSHGYGNDLYQKDFVDVATYNAKNKNHLAYPNKPYVPKVSEVSVNYKASDRFIFNEALSKSSVSSENKGEFVHITPFGLEEVITKGNVKRHTLLPSFKQDGYLILGLKGVRGNTTASIFFHFLQSSTGVNIIKEGLICEYYQLSNWEKFNEGDIILDQTNGFIQSGIIELVLPKVEGFEKVGNENTYWIRISTHEHPEHYPRIKGIYMNAVEAVCCSQDKLVLGKEIPAKSIVKPVVKMPDVKKVIQPTVSYGGILEGTADQFYTKVSERLRHKSRAASIWDYERLILGEFEDVRVVKCTNFDKSFNPLPGKVKVIVLSSNWTNTERYYYNKNKLSEMKTFLKKYSSPFVDIQVINPTIEYLLVNCVTEFKPEDNGGYYLDLLNNDISNFLSPISSIQNGVGGIGGNIVPNMVLSLFKNLSYIKKVEKLTIEHIVRDNGNEFSLGVYEGGEEIKVTTPWSILAPVKQHNIVNKLNNKLEVGIGNMEIGLDFILGDKNSINANCQQAVVSSGKKETKEVRDNAIFVFKNK